MRNEILNHSLLLKRLGLGNIYNESNGEIRSSNTEPAFIQSSFDLLRGDSLSTISESSVLGSEILFVTSFPPRECGIAAYSQDLIKAINNKFKYSFNLQICALESGDEHKHNIYPKEVKYILNTNSDNSFIQLANKINEEASIQIVVVQHEFGFFAKKEQNFIKFLNIINKPIIGVFHTVLPNPDVLLKENVQSITNGMQGIIVMTNSSENILVNDYGVVKEKITVIPHGTHLVPHANKEELKHKYHLSGKKVLSTFGLLSSGKSIETSLDALPEVVKKNPDVLFLIMGKTHPSIVNLDGEQYREMLEHKIEALHLQKHVRFINKFLPLPELLEYLQLTDIYLFTSKDPNQAVSGTFSYALSCGCPIISTPIPHAREVLGDNTGTIIDFGNSEQLAKAINTLLENEEERKNISSNCLHRMAYTAWENSAVAHVQLFRKISPMKVSLKYTIPEMNIDHVKRMTTDFGIIQFSKINQPDIESGYTLDDNARALIAMCQHYELTRDELDLKYIDIYFRFINFCLQKDGSFLNYVDKNRKFTDQNNEINLEDANGRAIWALGYLLSMSDALPEEYNYIQIEAEIMMQKAWVNIPVIHSTRAMAFIIKGLYYRNTKVNSFKNVFLIKELANRLVQMYRHEADDEWKWYESYLTYANSILPEALLCAWLTVGDPTYKKIAKSSFDFLLSKIFVENQMNVITNKGWMHKGKEIETTKGEQPIDVAYAIIALSKFYDVFKDEKYKHILKTSFQWFLGNNHLNQIIYNPCTGGCYDGLEEKNVNLNQGAESTLSYLMARLCIEKFQNSGIQKLDRDLKLHRQNQLA